MGDIHILSGLLSYKNSYDLMLDTYKSRVKGSIEDQFFILEHTPVFTLGKNGGEENLLVTTDLLIDKKIDLVPTDRGGNITYHGPGQIILYPVISIKSIKIGVREYIRRLEEITIITLKKFGVEGSRNKLNHGVWVNGKKIASVGVRIKNGVTLHGLAININTDLEPFNWINPCGLKDIKATSSLEVLNKKLNIDSVKESIKESIEVVFMECFY
ncbi:lipoyl(octanoyl) transferase [Thiospirochaeta perfilievii]|uniref:Octanoyltransferase n=1 Tax=Thiospirochaeta perfilievii TaxID=252967 RepID=A0A5C1Q9N8_9SPIO|nr:lipoyl(octanoyl) transferase LipB [Thiospirochaeta perfilievii]QEN03506.1 lipoyl(octanoyl) transferase [Thiospirochaeta perfilievii]